MVDVYPPGVFIHILVDHFIVFQITRYGRVQYSEVHSSVAT